MSDETHEGRSPYWGKHEGHDVGMRHEDGSLYSATCHDCGVSWNRDHAAAGLVAHPEPTPEPTVQRFRAWLGDTIWAADDMGGFVTGVTEDDAIREVGKLFDLLDPDWRDYTSEGRKSS